MKYNLNFDRFGTREIVPLPSDEELAEFYQKNYFQSNQDTVKNRYTNEEINCFHFYHKIFYEIIVRTRSKPIDTFLDVGCGEGFSSDWFLNKGVQVSAVDFSDFAIKNIHPNLLNNIEFKKCDLINDDFYCGRKFDLIALKNVLEHVKDPKKLIERVKRKMNKDSVLIVEVPNDTDNPIFDTYLKNTNCEFVDIPTFAPPDHLRYFSFDSLNSFMLHNGLKNISQISDFPIEMFLLDERTDYYKTNFGKTAHSIRCSMTNLIGNMDIDKVIKLMKTFAEIGIGRHIIGFYSIL